MAKLHHLVITRFSVNTKLAGKMQHRDADDAYLKYRLRLFEIFCLPSLACQTVKDFQWFVLFGENTPDWLRLRLDVWEKGQAFIPIYAPNFAGALDMVRRWVAINTQAGDQLLTTRLDNDDAISCHTAEYLHKIAKPEADLWYFCPRNGQQVVVRADDPRQWKFFKLGYPANPFVSMLERITGEPPRMIYHCKHGSIKTRVVGAPVQDLTFYPSWMQILHGKNIGNGLWTRSVDQARPQEFPFLTEYMEFGLPARLQLPG